jgi:VanZ family protein
LWLGALTATHVPPSSLPHNLPSDKTLHMVGYLVLSCAFMLVLAAYSQPRLRRIIAAVLIAGLYGAADEITQPLVGRTADVRDWHADMLGALAGIVLAEIIVWLIAKIRQRR